MNTVEWDAYLGEIFPPEIMGFKRPEEQTPSDLDFSIKFPQFIPKDGVGSERVNAFLRRLLSNDQREKEWIDAMANQLASCDLRLVTQTLKGLMSVSDKIKLDAMQEGATNYTHPATHPAVMIVLDALHRFVTDAQINTWNAKANASHGTHLPALETPNNSRFVRNDGTIQTVTPGNIGAYTKTEVDDGLNAKANLNSPSLTGTPSAPTPATADSSTKIATTAFVKSITETVTAKNSVAMLTGIISHGGTVPLPAGYTEAQCKWIVSVCVKHVDDDDGIICMTGSSVCTGSSNNNGNWSSLIQNAGIGKGRVVSCFTFQKGGGVANYLIIGVK